MLDFSSSSRTCFLLYAEKGEVILNLGCSQLGRPVLTDDNKAGGAEFSAWFSEQLVLVACPKAKPLALLTGISDFCARSSFAIMLSVMLLNCFLAS